MTRVPALPSSDPSADAQIDAAVMRLADLFAQQVARELAADAPDAKDTPNASTAPQKD
jgi:hypothetical protein